MHAGYLEKLRSDLDEMFMLDIPCNVPSISALTRLLDQQEWASGHTECWYNGSGDLTGMHMICAHFIVSAVTTVTLNGLFVQQNQEWFDVLVPAYPGNGLLNDYKWCR